MTHRCKVRKISSILAQTETFWICCRIKTTRNRVRKLKIALEERFLRSVLTTQTMRRKEKQLSKRAKAVKAISKLSKYSWKKGTIKVRTKVLKLQMFRVWTIRRVIYKIKTWCKPSFNKDQGLGKGIWVKTYVAQTMQTRSTWTQKSSSKLHLF